MNNDAIENRLRGYAEAWDQSSQQASSAPAMNSLPESENASGEAPAWFGANAAEVQKPQRPLLVVAAVVVIVALAGGLVWTASRQDKNGAVATSPTVPDMQSPQRVVPTVALPSEPIRGVDDPLVVLDRGGFDGRACFNEPGLAQTSFGVGPEFLGMPLIAETHFFEEVPGVAARTATIDLGDITVTCSETGPDGSTVGRGTPLVGTENGLPLVVVEESLESWSGDEVRRFSIDGVADESVESIALVATGIENQVFRRSGGRFRVDGTSTLPLRLDEEMQIEIIQSNGSSQVHDGLASFVDTCGSDSVCIGRQLSAIIDAATLAGSTSQVAVLDDFELTQDEYDAAIGRFQDCLPVDVAASVDSDSAIATDVRDCYSTNIEFVEHARYVQNNAWLATPEGMQRTLDFVASSSDVDEVAAGPAPVCGSELPVSLELLDASLPASDERVIDEAGVLVRMIELDSGDVVRVQWPAPERIIYELDDGIPLFSSVWLTFGRPPVATDDGVEAGPVVNRLTPTGPFEVELGPELELVVPLDFDTTTVSPGCEVFEVVVESEGETARFGWDLTYDDWTGSSPRSPVVDVAPLVTSSEQVVQPPTSLTPCQDASQPNQDGVFSGGLFDTPTEALADFLTTEQADTFTQSGFHEMIASDGSRTYGIHFDFLDRAPRSTDQFVTFITVTQAEEGWAVTSWSASGC